MTTNPHKYSDEIAHLTRCWLLVAVDPAADVQTHTGFTVFEIKGDAYPWVILDHNNLCVRQVDGETLRFSFKHQADLYRMHLAMDKNAYEIVEINGTKFTFTKEVEYTDDYSI